MLPNITYTPLSELSINIGPIRSGWMDIDVYDGTTNYSYVASYTTDPLNDLLDVTICFLAGTAYTDRMGNKINNYYYVDHDQEPGLIYWVFDVEADTLRLTIWEDPPRALVEYWNTGCDKGSLEYYDLIAGNPILPQPLFALQGNKKAFGFIMQEVFKTLDARTEDKTSFDGWGYKYSIENFALLVSLLR
jgi:hypothetical protein